MKILMTADTVGGVWTYAIELAQALAPRGVEVALATMGAPLSPDQARAALAVPNLTVIESAYKLEWMEDPWHDVARAGEWLLDLESWIQPDVVHLNGYAHGALPWRAPLLVVAHSCVMSWWRAVHGASAPDTWRPYCMAVFRGLHSADLVVAPTRAMLDAAAYHYGSLRRSRVIPNGRNAALFPPGLKEPFVIAAGRLWDEAKNIAALERVAPRLPWPVWVAGEARHPGGGTACARGVRCAGRLAPAELAAWLGRASIYALPARYEPFGLSVLEAALAGCALVVGDIPSLREVWGDAASFVAPGDDAALESALRALMEDPARCRDMARRARCHALRYTPGRTADEYVRVYRELAAERTTAAPAGGAPPIAV